MKSWVQLKLIFGKLKWIIITSVLISVLLFLPDQVRELYRVAADENGLRPLAIEYAYILVIGIVIWFGAVSHVVATLTSSQPFGKLPHRTTKSVPAALGSLPIMAAGLAQFFSRPELKIPVQLNVGSVIRIQAMSLESVKFQLTKLGVILILTSILMTIFMPMLNRLIVPVAQSINASYFSRHRSIVCSTAMIICIIALFIFFPVAVPQQLTALGVLTLFTICVTTMCIHFSLLTIEYQVPVIPIVLLYAFAIYAF